MVAARLLVWGDAFGPQRGHYALVRLGSVQYFPLVTLGGRARDKRLIEVGRGCLVVIDCNAILSRGGNRDRADSLLRFQVGLGQHSRLRLSLHVPPPHDSLLVQPALLW